MMDPMYATIGSREMTLGEWVQRLPAAHLAHRQYDDLMGRIASLESALAEAKEERDGYREANESVAVCAEHVGKIIDVDHYLPTGCVVCKLDSAWEVVEAAEAVLRMLPPGSCASGKANDELHVLESAVKKARGKP